MEARGTDGDANWLVFGLSGQVGSALLAARLASDPGLVAPSRRVQPVLPGVRWCLGGLADFPDPTSPVAAIASLGPLDAFARWFEASRLAPARIVALGSTSVHGKRGSPDPAERRLVQSLEEAERRLADISAERGCALTLLRPTLIYGLGRDRNLSRLVGLARRWGWLPLPLAAGGLRQPVHVADVAQAVLAALRRPAPCPGAFDLPGGESLPFDRMVARTLAAAAPDARVVRLPGPLFRAGVRLLRMAGRIEGAGEGMLARLDQDLAYDPAPVRAALSLSLRGFQPTGAMFPG
jgi:nucleoside-diphosphate-sugar epimerase